VNVLLDTNVCIAIMNRRPPIVRDRFISAIANGDVVAVSSIVVFELWYGIASSTHRQGNIEQLSGFSSAITVLPFDAEDARVAGEIRADLRRKGTPIGTYDYLIAGQALRRGTLLITANVREFSRVEGLHWQDWSA
jgi:tRNA(fMet)-specific endonuclease VapC